MRIKTVIRQLAAYSGRNPWRNLHIYVTERDPRTGLYERTYLDLRRRPDERPYFVPSQNQAEIRRRDREAELRAARQERRRAT